MKTRQRRTVGLVLGVLVCVMLAPVSLAGQLTATYSGTVQGAPVGKTFWLVLAPGRTVHVVALQARYTSGSQVVATTALTAGAHVVVQGRLMFNQITATEVQILPAAVAAAPPRPPFYHPVAPGRASALPAGTLMLTGTVRQVRAGYLLLAPASRSPLWVRTTGAQLQQSGRPAFPSALRPGGTVQVQGRMVGAQLWASLINVAAPAASAAAPARPQTPGFGVARVTPAGVRKPVVRMPAAALTQLAAFRVPPLRLVAPRTMSQLHAQQSAIQQRLNAVNAVWENRFHVPISSPYESRQPYHPPLNNASLVQPAAATPFYLAPIASLMANGDAYANWQNGQLPENNTFDVMGLQFFGDPPRGWSDFFTENGQTMQPQFVGLGTNLTLGAPQPTISAMQSQPIGSILVNSTQLVLEIPCYYTPSSGGENYPEADFQVELQTQDPKSGNWSNAFGGPYTLRMFDGDLPAGAQASSTVMVVPQAAYKPYVWSIPITLNSANANVINTVRLAAYITLDGSDQAMHTSAGPNGASAPQGVAVAFPSGAMDDPVEQRGSTLPDCAKPLTAQQVASQVSCIDSQLGHDWRVSPPFQIVIAPTGLNKLDAMPYGIVYVPPGNQGSANLEAVSSTSGSVSFGLSGQTSTQLADTDSQSFTTQGGLGFAGVSYEQSNTLGSSQTFVTGQTSSNGVTETFSASNTLKTGYGASYCGAGSVPPQDQESLMDEPFWCDQMLFLVHPVFAVWSYANPDGSQFTASQLISYNASVDSSYKMRDLYACAYGGSLNPRPGAVTDGSSYPSVNPAGSLALSGTHVRLTAQECAAFVALDPFAAARWQGAPLNPARFDPVMAIPLDAISKGSSESGDLKQLQSQSQGAQTSSSTMNGSSQTQFGSTSDQVKLSGAYDKLSGNGGGGSTSAWSSTQSSAMTVTYSANQTETKTAGLEVKVNVADQGAGAIPTTEPMVIYQDLEFGGLAVQDPNEETPQQAGMAAAEQHAAQQIVPRSHGFPGR